MVRLLIGYECHLVFCFWDHLQTFWFGMALALTILYIKEQQKYFFAHTMVQARKPFENRTWLLFKAATFELLFENQTNQ
jgi:dolichol kinase